MEHEPAQMLDVTFELRALAADGAPVPPGPGGRDMSLWEGRYDEGDPSFKSTVKRCSPITAASQSDLESDDDDESTPRRHPRSSPSSASWGSGHLSAARTTHGHPPAITPDGRLRLSSSNIKRLEAMSGGGGGGGGHHAPPRPYVIATAPSSSSDSRSGFFGLAKWALSSMGGGGGSGARSARSAGGRSRSRSPFRGH